MEVTNTEKALIGKVMFIGDVHLHSSDYGGHVDYKEESLENFKRITKLAEEENPTHIIGTGDFTMTGQFSSISYRMAVRKELQKQNKITKKNRYELRGNHDVEGRVTEYDDYIDQKLLKTATQLSIGNVNISMVDFGKIDTTEVLIEEGKFNVIVAHDYLMFSKSKLPNFGAGYVLDSERFEKWYGVDLIVGGHIHKIMTLQGEIHKGNESKSVVVDYLGCMNRPALEEEMDKIGRVAILEIYDDGSVNYRYRDFELQPIEEAFNLAQKLKEKDEREKKVQLKEALENLGQYNKITGDPMKVIQNMSGISEEIKQKAIDLLLY